MLARKLLVASLVSILAACGVAGCAADSTEEEADATGDTGDGTDESALISEHQLTGSELPDKTIALTFDDGPGPRTAELADYLASKGIPGAFFINGKNVPGRQLALDTILARGHLLANHTQNHLQLTRLSSDKVVSEVTQTDAIVTAEQPNGPFLLRAPFGAMNGNVVRAINATPMKKYTGSVFWDMGGVLTTNAAADWDCWGKHVTVQRCGDLYVSEIERKRKGIVLMHDVHNPTIDMVKYIVPRLQQDGFKFVKLTDVPSISRALGAASAPDNATDEGSCMSSSIGKRVAEKTCVQSRRDQKWYVCAAGDWASVPAGNDARCATSIALP